MAKKNLKDDRRLLSVAMAIALVAILAVAIGVILGASPPGDADPTYEYDVVYNPNGATKAGGGDAVAITAHYDGIISTEYNPEYWYDTLPEGTPGNLPAVSADNTNWVGPTNSTPIIVKTTVKVRVQPGEYTITYPAGVTIDSAERLNDSKSNVYLSNVTTDTPDNHTLKFTSTGDNTGSGKTDYVLIVYLGMAAGTVHKVFGGWSTSADSGTVYLPGDVVPNGTTTLYAYWIEPDFYSRQLSISYNNWSSNTYTISSGSDIIPQDHLEVGKKNSGDNNIAIASQVYGNINDGDRYGTFTVPGNGTNYLYDVTFGNGRQAPSLFGSIYELTENVNMASSLPTGTYRSASITPSNVLTSASVSQKITITATSSYVNSGDIVFDNVNISGPSSLSAHGNANNGIYAGGHILIMGKGIKTLHEVQVFGGINNAKSSLTTQIDGNVYTPEMDEKAMVSKASTETTSVKIATCVIIHSGIYFNIGAGSRAGSIGSSSVTDLCIYMVLKGGTAIDSVFGTSMYGYNSAGKDNGEEYCDAYLYITGFFMPGDDYVDTQTGDKTSNPNSTKLRDYFADNDFSVLKDVSVVNGGPRKAVMHGDTHVFITDHASVYDITGAGRENTSGVEHSNLEISGSAIVRHVACGGAMNAISTQVQMVDHTNVTILGNCKIASVYGAGYDIWAAPSNKTTTMYREGTTIDITMDGGTVGNIYGGGYRGSIGSSTNTDNLTITITIKNGTVIESVYGGGSGGVDKAKHNNASGARYNDSAAGWTDSSGYSKVYGNINVNIEGGTIGDSVYGGGMSVPQLLEYKGSSSFLSGSDRLVAQVFGDTKVTVSGGTIGGSVYGGGKGVEWSYNTDPDVTGINKYSVTDTTKTPLMTSSGLIKVEWYTNGSNNTVTFQRMNANTILYNSNYNPDNDRAYMYSGDYLKYAQVIGNSEVYIKGGTVTGSVFGGGSFGVVTGSAGEGGNTYVEITGGKIKENVYGGGLGIDTIVAVSGKRIVNIDYASVDRDHNIIDGSVYGSSSIGDDGDKASFPVAESGYSSYVDKGNHDSIIVVNQAYIGDPALSQDSSLYGGGFMGKTFGNSYVYVGYQFEYKDSEYPLDPTKNSPFNGHVVSYELQDPSKKKIISVNSIYAGGNVTTSDGEVANPYTEDLIMGYGYISVNGNGANNGISIDGSIMGSGNSCNTRWSSTIEISDLDNTAHEITGIHRADVLSILQSKLYITNRSTLTEVAGAPKDLSLFDIGQLYLKYDTTLTITAPADYIYEYYSYSKDNKPTTLTSPSNHIIFTTGSTFYIRDMRDTNNDGTEDSLEYGSVSGYTVIESRSETGSGAYVIADQNSSYGGFVITKEGTYKEADFSVFPLNGKNLKCWFISGTQNKVITMNLPFNGTETEARQSTVSATLDIMKMQSDTDMRYTGATLTSVSTDNYGNSFEFIRPGTETKSYEFGMLIGYKEQGDNTPGLLYADKERTLNVVGNNTDGYHTEKVKATYYSDDPNEKDGSLEPQTEGVTTTVPLAPVNLVSNSKDVGSYKLNLVFTGKPENTTLYIGYMMINLQEVTVISYESTDSEGHIITSTNTMVANNINIRVDLYVIGSGAVTNDSEYKVVLKADEDAETNLCSGYAEILIPTGFLMGKLTLQNVTVAYVPDGQSITIAAYKNGDNTTGWMNVNDPVTWTQHGANEDNPTIGTMSGTVVATIRYTIDHFTYPDLEEDQKPQFTLYFRTILKDGTTVDSAVTVVIQKKDMHAVTFYDNVNNLSDTLYYPDGYHISANSWRDMGYNFIGWYTDSDFMNMFDYNTPITKDISLYARFSFIVTFDNMNGTSSKMYVAADSNGAILLEDLVPKPTNKGYELKGWYKDRDGIVAWDYAFDTVTQNTTLYAKWSGIEVKINFYYWDSDDQWALYGGTEHPNDLSQEELEATITGSDPYVDKLGNTYTRTGSGPYVYTVDSLRLYNGVINNVREYQYQATSVGLDTTYSYKVYNGTAFVDIVDDNLKDDIKNLNGFSFKSSADGKYYKMIDSTHFRCVSDGSWKVKTGNMETLGTEFGITYTNGVITAYTVYKDENQFRYESSTYSEYIGTAANGGWLALSGAPSDTYYKDKDGVHFYMNDGHTYYRGEYDASLVKAIINVSTHKDQFGNLYDDVNAPTQFITRYNDLWYKYVFSTGEYWYGEGEEIGDVSWTPCDSDPGIVFKKSGSTDNYTLLSKKYVSKPVSYTMIWLDAPYYPTVKYGSAFNVEDPKQSTSDEPMYALDYAQEMIQQLIGTDKFIRWQLFPDNDPSGVTSYGIYTDTILSSDMINLDDSTWGGGRMEINLYALTARVAISLTMDKNVNDASAKVTAPSSFLVYPTPTSIDDTGEYYDTACPLHPDYFTEKGTGANASLYKKYTDDAGNYYYKIIAKTIAWSGSDVSEIFNIGTTYHVDFTDTAYHNTVPSLTVYDENDQQLSGYTVTVTDQSLPYGTGTGPDGLHHIYAMVTVTTNSPSSFTGTIKGDGLSFDVLIGAGIPESYLSEDGKTRYNYNTTFSYYEMRDENYFEPYSYDNAIDGYDYYIDRYGNVYECQSGHDIYTEARVVLKKLYGADTLGIEYKIDASTGKFQVYEGIDTFMYEHGLTAKNKSASNTYSTREEVIEGYEMGMDGDVYTSQLYQGERILFYYDKGISFSETINGAYHSLVLSGKTSDNTSKENSLWPTVNGFGQLNYNLSNLSDTTFMNMTGKYIWIFQKSTALSVLPSGTIGMNVVMDGTANTQFTRWVVCKPFNEVDEDVYAEDLSILLPQDGTEVTLAVYYADTDADVVFNDDGSVSSGTCTLLVRYDIQTNNLMTEVDLDGLAHDTSSKINSAYYDWTLTVTGETRTLSGAIHTNVQFIGTNITIGTITNASTPVPTAIAPVDVSTFLIGHCLEEQSSGLYSTQSARAERYAMGLDSNKFVSQLNSEGPISIYTYEGIALSQTGTDNDFTVTLSGKTSDNSSLSGSPYGGVINGYGFLDLDLSSLSGTLSGKHVWVYQKSTALSLMPSSTPRAAAVGDTNYTKMIREFTFTGEESYDNDIHVLLPQDGTDVILMIYYSDSGTGIDFAEVGDGLTASSEGFNLLVKYRFDTTRLKTEVNLIDISADHPVSSTARINTNYEDWSFDKETRTLSGVIGVNAEFLGRLIVIDDLIDGSTMNEAGWLDSEPVSGYYYRVDDPSTPDPRYYDRYVKIDDTHYRMIDWKAETITLGDQVNNEYTDTLGLGTVWKDYYSTPSKTTGRYDLGLDGDAFKSDLGEDKGVIWFYADKDVAIAQTGSGDNYTLTLTGKTKNNSAITGSPSSIIRGYGFMDMNLKGLKGMSGQTLVVTVESTVLSLLPNGSAGAAVTTGQFTKFTSTVAYDTMSADYDGDIHILLPQDRTDVTIKIYLTMEGIGYLRYTYTLDTTGLTTEVDLDSLTAGHQLNTAQINPAYEDWTYIYRGVTKTLSGTLHDNVQFIGTSISVGDLYQDSIIVAPEDVATVLSAHGLDVSLSDGKYSSSLRTIGRYDMGLDGAAFDSTLSGGRKVKFFADKNVSFLQTGSSDNFTLTLTGKTSSNPSISGSPFEDINGYGYMDISLSDLSSTLFGKYVWVFQKSTVLSLLPSGSAGAAAIADTESTRMVSSFAYSDANSFSNDIHVFLPQDGTNVIVMIYYADTDANVVFNDDGSVSSGTCTSLVRYTIVTSGLNTEIDLDGLTSHPAAEYTRINTNYSDWEVTKFGLVATLSGTDKTNAVFIGKYVMLDPGFTGTLTDKGMVESDSKMLVGLNAVHSDLSDTVYRAMRTYVGDGIVMWNYFGEHGNLVYQALWNSHTGGTGRWTYTDYTGPIPTACEKRGDFYLLTTDGTEYVNFDDTKFSIRDWYIADIIVDPVTHLDQFQNHYSVNDDGEYVLDYSIIWVNEREYYSEYYGTTSGVEIWNAYEIIGTKEVAKYTEHTTPVTAAAEIAALGARFGVADPNTYDVTEIVLKNYGSVSPLYFEYSFESKVKDAFGEPSAIYRFILSKISDTSGFVVVGKEVYEDGEWTYYTVMNPNASSPQYLAGAPMATTYYKDKYSNEYITYNNRLYTCVSGSDTYYEFSFKLNEATRTGYKLSGWHNTHVNTDDALYPTSGLYRTLKLFYHAVDGKTVISKEVLDTTDTLGNKVTYVTIDYEKYEAESKDYSYYTYGGSNLPRLDNPEHMYGVEYLALWTPIEYTVNVTSTPNGNMNVFKVNSDGSRTLITKNATVKYGDRIELTYSPNGVYQFSKWNITGEYSIGDEYSTSTTMVVHGNCSITASEIGERVVIIPIRFDDTILSDSERENVTVKLRNTITDVEYPLQNVGHDSGAEEFREYIPLNSSDPNEEYEVLIYYTDGDKSDPQPYRMVGTFRVDKDNELTFAYDVISARIVDKIVQKDSGPDYTEINGTRLDEGEMIVEYEIDDNIVVSVTRYVGVLRDYIEGNYEGYIINNPYNEMPSVKLTMAAGFDYTVYEGFPDIDSSGEEYFDVNTQWNYHSGHTFSETTVTFDLNWTRTDKPADIIVKMTANSNPRYDVVFVAGNNYDTTSGNGLTRETEPGGFRTAINSANTNFNNSSGSLYIGAGNAIQGWYYNSSFSDPIQDLGNVVLDDNAISKLELYKEGDVYHVYAKVVDASTMFTIGVDVYTQNTTDTDGYTKVSSNEQVLNLEKGMQELSTDVGFDEVDGSYYSSSIVSSGRYQKGLDGNPYSTSISVGAGTFYASEGVTFYQTARDGKYVNLSISGKTTNNTSIYGSPWPEISGYGYFDLNLKPSGVILPDLSRDLYVWVYQKSTALSARTSVFADEVCDDALGGYTVSIRSYHYSGPKTIYPSYATTELLGTSYENDIHILIPQDGTDMVLAIYFVYDHYVNENSSLNEFSEVSYVLESGAVLIGSMTINTSSIKTEVDLDDLATQNKDHDVSLSERAQLNTGYSDWVYTYSTKTLSGAAKANTTFIGTDIHISGESFTEAYVKSHGLDEGTDPYSSSLASTGRYAKGLDSSGYSSALDDSGSVTFYVHSDITISQTARDGNDITLAMVGVAENNTANDDAVWGSNINGYGFFDINLKGLSGMAGKTLYVYQKSSALSILPSASGAVAIGVTKFSELTTAIAYDDIVDTYASDLHVLIPQDGTDIVIEIYHTSKTEDNLIASYIIKTTNVRTQVDLSELVIKHKDHNAGATVNSHYVDWTFNSSTSTTGGLPKPNVTFLGYRIQGPSNIYAGMYYLDERTGFHIVDDGTYPSMELTTGATSYEVRSNYKDGVMTSVSVVLMVDESELSPGKSVLTVRYDRNTVKFNVNTTIRDTVSWEGGEYTARYGDTVTLPTVTRDNISLIGWTSSPRISISAEAPYTYTVTAADSGTINLTPQFDPSQFVTVTFVSPIGVFEANGQHRISIDVAKDDSVYGTFTDLTDCPQLVGTQEYILLGYDGLTYDTPFTEDVTVTAYFQSTNHNIVFRAEVPDHCEVSGVKDSSSDLLNVGGHNDLEYHSEITLTINPTKGRALAIAETKEWAYQKLASGEPISLDPEKITSRVISDTTYYFDQFGNCYSDSACTSLVYSIVWVYEGTEDKAHTIGYYTQYKIEGDRFYRQTGNASSDNWVQCDPLSIYFYKPIAVGEVQELISGGNGKFKMYCHDYEKEGNKYQLMLWNLFTEIGNPIKVTEEGRYQWSFFLDTCLDLTIHTTEISVNLSFVVNGKVISDTDMITVYSQDKTVIAGYQEIGAETNVVEPTMTYSAGKYYDEYGNCYRDAEGTKLEYSIVWVPVDTNSDSVPDYYLQYRITESSVKTYEQNTGTATVGEGVNWTKVNDFDSNYCFKLYTAYSAISGEFGHFVIGGDSYSRVLKPAEYIRGANVPMYSSVYFGKTLLYDDITYNNVRWYTDRACTNEFTFNDGRYEYLATDDLTLYTNIGYVTVFFYDNQGVFQRGSMCETQDGRITLPAVKYKVDGYIFVGWGVLDPDSSNKNVFTYAPESTFLYDGTDLHLYAYYLQGGVDENHPYSGKGYSVSIDLCEDTGTDTVEQFTDTSSDKLSLLVKYSVDQEITNIYGGSDQTPVFTDFTNSRVYYYGQIANGSNISTFSGSMSISITKVELYIIAPSKSQVYDPDKTAEENTISVSSADIQMIAATPTGEVPNPEDITAVVLDTEMSGYTDRLSEPGSVRTAASIYFMEGKEENYIIHYVDGSLILYDRDSSRYYYGGS